MVNTLELSNLIVSSLHTWGDKSLKENLLSFWLKEAKDRLEGNHSDRKPGQESWRCSCRGKVQNWCIITIWRGAKHYAEWKKPGAEECVLYAFTDEIQESIETNQQWEKAGQWLPRTEGEDDFKGTRGTFLRSWVYSVIVVVVVFNVMPIFIREVCSHQNIQYQGPIKSQFLC